MSQFLTNPIKITYPSQVHLIKNAKMTFFIISKFKITASAQLCPGTDRPDLWPLTVGERLAPPSFLRFVISLTHSRFFKTARPKTLPAYYVRFESYVVPEIVICTSLCSDIQTDMPSVLLHVLQCPCVSYSKPMHVRYSHSTSHTDGINFSLFPWHFHT